MFGGVKGCLWGVIVFFLTFVCYFRVDRTLNNMHQYPYFNASLVNVKVSRDGGIFLKRAFPGHDIALPGPQRGVWGRKGEFGGVMGSDLEGLFYSRESRFKNVSKMSK